MPSSRELESGQADDDVIAAADRPWSAMALDWSTFTAVSALSVELRLQTLLQKRSGGVEPDTPSELAAVTVDSGRPKVRRVARLLSPRSLVAITITR